MSSIKNLQNNLPEAVDCLLVTNEIHQRYLTSFPFTDGYVLVSKKNAWLLTDFRYIEAAEKFASNELNVIMFEDRKLCLDNILNDNGLKTVGVEDDLITLADYEKLKIDYPKNTFVKAGGIIEKIRRYKTKEEVDNIIAAQRIAEKALDRLLSLMTPDMTEKECALELDFGMRRFGAEGCSFETIAVSGAASSMPHGVPRDVKLEKGFFTMDFGALYNGYCSDMTRTIVIGKADEEIKKVYNTVLKAQLDAEAFIDAGKLGCDCDKVARDIIYKAGYEGCFGHSLGHAVGMLIHEEPRLSMKWKEPLEVGNVVTVEPGIYIPGKYGCRIEDMMYLSETGPVILTNAKKELIEMF